MNKYNPNIPLDYIAQDNYDIDETKEYTLETLKLGMRVHTGQLKDIKYTYILVANPILISIDDYTKEYAGTVVYIGDVQNETMKTAWEMYTVNKKRPCKVYNVDDETSDKFTCPPDNGGQ